MVEFRRVFSLLKEVASRTLDFIGDVKLIEKYFHISVLLVEPLYSLLQFCHAVVLSDQLLIQL